MRETFLNWSDKIIRYGIYSLFLLIPLIFTNSTSELFELNKMWLTWEITVIIAAAWLTKMILEGRVYLRRTPLDIPLLLFLLSQILSTIFSLDPHTSFWGYYSRFNGGLLSTITYIFLYYAIATNLRKEHVLQIVKLSLLSGILVALWGFPSHFGMDPTCLLFQGSFDVSCWTDAFKPTVRIFSTLGQPAWLAAYLNVLIPLSIVSALLFLFKGKTHDHEKKTLATLKPSITSLLSWKFVAIMLVLVLFFACLIFTNTRAGIIAFWLGNSAFWLFLALQRYFSFRSFLTLAVAFNSMFLLLHFFLGTSFTQLDRFTLPGLLATTQTVNSTTTAQPTEAAPPAPAGAFGGTDSGKIRQIVWQGAVDAWKAYPIIGSGVETFAFAYYLHRPADHNLTSEWDYLYNKAHNEYLNYLTTTGVLGLGTYLLFIVLFLFLAVRYLLTNRERTSESIVILAFVVGFITLLITNFFGFSVVISNLYLFLIPVFVFLLDPVRFPLKSASFPRELSKSTGRDISGFQWTSIITVMIISIFFLLVLIRFWYADRAYALGSNLNNVQEYQQSYLKLGEAISLRSSEPTFKDEFAVNNAMIAALLLLQDAPATPSAEVTEQARLLSDQAIALSNEIVQNHPNNISFWKSRVRLFYALSQVDKRYLAYAIDAVEHVNKLAPTDAKVMYNLGALYQENGNSQKSSEVLEQAILLKPNYRDAYLALGNAYHTLAVDEKNQITDETMHEKAVRQLRFILDRLSPDDTQAKETLTAWEAEK